MSAQQAASAAIEQPSRAASVVRADGLHKTFRSGSLELRVLNGVNLEVAEGEMIAIVGPSGSGKSTLLHLLAALDTPSSGAIYFSQKALDALSEAERAEYRNRSVGFVWQRHHLLPDFSAAENVAMPLLLRGAARGAALADAQRWLSEVGLAARAAQMVAQLSGGEQQRVAIARALAGSPRLLLADEPTGDLDENNAELIFQLMQRLHQALRLTSIIATHNLSLAARCDRELTLEHGVLRCNRQSQGKQDHV